MHDHLPRTPRTAPEASRYLNDLRLTNAHLRARMMERERSGAQPGLLVGRHALQEVMRQTVLGLDSRESERFDTSYNTLLATLPLLRRGEEGLRRRHCNNDTNLADVVEFNHALRDYISTHASISRGDFRKMFGSTMNALHYDDALIDQVLWEIFPGMENEVVGEEMLYYVPGNMLVLDGGERPEDLAQAETPLSRARRTYADIHGIDNAVIDMDINEMITIDFKKSKQAAIEAQASHERWLKRHHKDPDNHIVIWPGYTQDDFVPGKIGRVKPEAREREQPRVDGLVLGKFDEIRARKAVLTK